MAIRKHKTVQEVRSELKDQSNKRLRFSDFPELQYSFSPEKIQKLLPEKNNQLKLSQRTHTTSFISNRRSLYPTFASALNNSNKHPQAFPDERKKLLISNNGEYNLNLQATSSSSTMDLHSHDNSQYSPLSVDSQSDNPDSVRIEHNEYGVKINNTVLTWEQFCNIELVIANNPSYNNILNSIASSLTDTKTPS